MLSCVRFVTACIAAKASFYPHPQSDTVPIRLYVKINGVLQCINDLLVEKQIAVEGDLYGKLCVLVYW